jgi:dUTP pyrophosphatase
MRILRIKPLNSTISEMYENHGSYHQGDSGIDLFTTSVEALPGNMVKIDFQIQCELLEFPQNKNVSYLLVPRSSIVKTPYRMANSIGVIDAAYRGNIMAFIDSKDGSIPEIGTRLFQIICGDLKPIYKIEVVSELSETDRGAGGFGSTGK